MAKQTIRPRQRWQTRQQKPARCFRLGYSWDWPAARAATPFSQSHWRRPGMSWAVRPIRSAKEEWPLFHWPAHRDEQTNRQCHWFGAQFEWGRPAAAAVSSPLSRCRHVHLRLPPGVLRCDCQPGAGGGPRPGRGWCHPGRPGGGWSCLPSGRSPRSCGGSRRLTEWVRCWVVPGSGAGAWGAPVLLGPWGAVVPASPGLPEWGADGGERRCQAGVTPRAALRAGGSASQPGL